MREQFEKLPSISCILDRGVYFDQENNMYKGGSDEDYFWINGAWYSFQEQQKKIDEALEIGYEKRGNAHYLVDEHIDEIQGLLE